MFVYNCKFKALLVKVLNLVEEIATAAPDDFSVFIPQMLPYLLSSLTVPYTSQVWFKIGQDI